jgi:hypothetical protein
MAWWGAIAGSVRQGATTAEVWEAIRGFGEANSLAYPPGMFQAVNEMRSLAAGLRVSSERLARAKPETAITGREVAPLPYARDSVSQALARQFHVRVEYTATRQGETERSYITLPYTGGLPGTVGQLYADAEIAAESLVGGYGADLVSVDRIEVGEW